MIIETQKEFDALGKDGITAVKGNLKIVCEIITKTKIIVTNGCLEAGDIYARNISASDIDAHDISADDISAYDIYARNIDAGDIGAHDISAHNLRYSTLCGTYSKINYGATKTEGDK